MLNLIRRAAAAILVGAAFTACSQAQPDEQPPVTTAKLELVEYASWTCSHCFDFHEDVYPVLKSEYIDTGKITFELRDFPTPPVNVAVAGFKIARCAGGDKRDQVIDDLFAAQSTVLGYARNGGDIVGVLQNVANKNGMDEAAFNACLEDKETTTQIVSIVSEAQELGVQSTPTLFVNGEKVEGYQWRTVDGMRTYLDGLLEGSATINE